MKFKHLTFIFLLFFSCYITPKSFAGTPPREINAEGKDISTGRITLEVAGVCGQDYWLVSPINADFWEVTIYIESEMKEQYVHIRIIEVIGEYPYNWEEQDAPTISSKSSATLTVSLDPQKEYEIWIRDGYAKPFTGYIEENWFSLDHLSAYDYLFLDPGHYIIFQESHGTTLNYEKELEMVYQYAKNDGMFITLDFLDREHYDSSLLGGVHGDKIAINSGYPSKNEHGYWYLLSLPISFAGGDIWKWNEAGYLVTYVGERTVNGMVFDHCIKVSIDSTQVNREHSRGEGDVYFARNVGIIEWELRKLNGEIFNLQVQEYGELSPVNVSGRLTLDGRYSATGYYVGLSNFHENDASNTIVDETGRFSLLAFGHKITLRCAKVAESGWLDFDDHIEYEIFNIEGNVTDLVISMGYPPLPDKVNIDNSAISDERCDVGTIQQISIHASWAWDFSDATSIYISIDGTPYLTNTTGWISYTVQSEDIDQKEWTITDVSDCDEYNIHITSPHVIWDKIEISTVEVTRQDVTSDAISWTGKYLFNDEAFQGSIILNNTLSNKQVEKYGYRVMGISDSKYGLKFYQANDFEIIFDRVSLNISLADNRIDVDEEPEIAVSGIYEYDSQPFLGSIEGILDFPADGVNEYPIHIEGINDPLYGITSYTQNDVHCIWDQVVVEFTLSDGRLDIGEQPEITYTAYYDFDSHPFEGVIHRNEPSDLTQVGDFSYSVESIDDTKFGLTVFVSENATCIWDRVKITEGGVSKTETTVKRTETVWFRAEYEYDSEPFEGQDGLLYLNDEPMEWSPSNQRWESDFSSDSPETLTFKITGIQDDTYDLTIFDDTVGEQSIEWKQAGIPGFPFHSVLLGVLIGLIILLKTEKRLIRVSM
ncbi:MAG: hypothetical protein E3J41_02920 [Candidatus Cloacimonadota bacterium]|nr:MAG: hypothetical protein E3J41_02920 [Candidatus Cloacimonadota bacterium]